MRSSLRSEEKDTDLVSCPGAPDQRRVSARRASAPGSCCWRAEQIATLTSRLREGQGVTLVGPRRIGKTTVCDAVCAKLATTHLVVRVEVPEGPDASLLWTRVAAECKRSSPADGAKRAWNVFRPAVLEYFKGEGLTVDLPKLEADPASASSRAALTFPLAVAEARGVPLVFFLDELQRVVDYGAAVIADLVDLYGTRAPGASLLVDGSVERTLDQLIGEPHHLGKVAPRETLPERIPTTQWRHPLTDRFGRLGLSIEEFALQRLLAWGDGRPYATVAAASEAAFSVRKADATHITDLDVEYAIPAARRRIDDDNG